jgi:hypothetical protein
MAAAFTYTSVPNTLRKFLKGIPSRAVPPRVTAQYLASIGLKEVNDSSIIRVLKFVGLVDGSRNSTEAFRQFRDEKNGPTALARQLQSAYKELYDTYDNAHNESDQNLSSFFKAKTDVGEKAIRFMVATFKVLSEFASFSEVSLTDDRKADARSASSVGIVQSTSPAGPQIHINLQIHLPPEGSPATYDAIFEALSRRLGTLV